MQDRSLMMKMEYSPQRQISHILSANDAASLMKYVEIRVHEEGCNHTHRFCQAWLDEHVSFVHHHAIMNELEDMGGYCDCEVLQNCYEDYKL